MALNKIKLARTFILSILFGIGFWSFANLALAADLKLNPASGNYKVGDTITLSVQLSSPSQAANAVYGVVNFPTNKLQVTSISKAGSVINLWVQEPGYSNSKGTVTLEGAILNPGYTGSAGRVLTINFKAKAEGTASITFSNGSILANDGEGTSILKKLSPATLTITEAEKIAKEEPKKEITKESTKTAKATPVVQIDTEGPRLEVNEIKLPSSSLASQSGHASFVFVAVDEGSGLDRYEITVDGSRPLIIPDGETNTYNTPALSSGSHTLTVTAYDKAGNSTTKILSFRIDLPINRSWFVNLGGSLIIFLSVLIPVISLLLILIIIIILAWRKLDKNKSGVKKEASDAEDKLHQTMNFLYEDLQDQMSSLEKTKSKRALTALEKKILSNIKSDLTEAEKFLKQEIEDIKDQVK